MLIHVRLFAMIREKAGTSALTLELPENARVADAAAALAERLPAVAAYLSRVAFAVNEAYAAREALLRPGDELAIIPPVSGGTGARGAGRRGRMIVPAVALACAAGKGPAHPRQ